MSALETVFIFMLSVSTMLGVIFLLSWLTIERKPYCLTWSILFWVSVLNMLLNAGKGLFPSPESYWVVVNISSLVMQGLSLAGYRQRAGLRGYPWQLLLSLALVELAVVWFTLVQPHMGLRMVMIPYSGALVGLLCVKTLASPGRPMRPVERALCLVFVLYALSQFGSGTLALLQGAQRDPYYLNLYSGLNFLVMPPAFIGLGLFTVLLLADDLAGRMRALATTDDLTGLLNRRGFEEATNRLLASGQTQGLFAAMADIDHFKAINDNFGHAMGDAALARFAQLLTTKVRSTDIAARIGGEEFILLFQAADSRQALGLVERLRREVEQSQAQTGRDAVSFTASFGLAQIQAQDDLCTLLRQADQALYDAKRQGRNRTCVYGEGHALSQAGG
ncbi:GGDEF domain-containing protein [Gallaecimonas kandeliae]|uniref:GGDEF domain-containing protein n=1 Tax=Gallaecimonas kandeliae TaxID=3029055 RepID=UPI002648551C|nr:GGDEF domain-containing protein [Gallaecimonas kandeliae]WKE65393.1 GGDEF domain-containing protein [Gallaecimonas kandeliae]